MNAALLIGVSLVVAAPAKDAPKKEATLVGSWSGVKATFGGQDRPVPEGGIEFTFEADGALKIRDGKNAKPKIGSYKLDAKKTPQEIDIIPPEDKRDDGTLMGIYKLDGDTLTIALTRGKGGDRPSKFESPEGSMVIVMTLKRAKKE